MPVEPKGRQATHVRRVPIIAILMIVHGVVAALGGIALFLLVGLFVAVPQMSEQMGASATQIFIAMYAVIGVILILVGILQIVAGFRNYRFRGRQMGLVALGSGLLYVFTFYCAITGIPLAIVGLITYLNPVVKEAFAMGDRGASREEILVAFFSD